MVKPVFPPCKLPEVRLRLLLEDELLISPACSILWEENIEISKFLEIKDVVDQVSNMRHDV